MQVTARELKQRLGQYLGAALAGETVRVSLRGKVIAEIKPVAPQGSEQLERLVREGLATPGQGSLHERQPVPSQRSASEIIIAERE